VHQLAITMVFAIYSHPEFLVIRKAGLMRFILVAAFVSDLCTAIHRNLRGLRRIFSCDTNPEILRFHRFLRVVLLVAAVLRWAVR
jgi:hypothetical protein